MGQTGFSVHGIHTDVCRLARDTAYGAGTFGVFVDYNRSLEGHYPIAFEQTYEVTKYVAQNVDESKSDHAPLVISDDGIGGNMVGAVRLLARECDRPSIRFQLLFSGMIGGEVAECPHNEFANGPLVDRVHYEMILTVAEFA